MTAQITTLGIAVDSSGVRRASDDLDQLGRTGQNAAQGVTATEGSMLRATTAGVALGTIIDRIVTATFDAARNFYNLGTALGEYQDLAETVGSDDPAGLASLQVAADVAGVSLGQTVMAMNRMSFGLSRVRDDTQPAARALNALGLSVSEFKDMKPDEQFRALARAFNEFGEGEGKAAVAMELFGRGGANQLKLMKELASETSATNYVTNEQIQRADDLVDAQTRSSSSLRMYASALSAEMLPAVTALTGAILIGDAWNTRHPRRSPTDHCTT